MLVADRRHLVWRPQRGDVIVVKHGTSLPLFMARTGLSTRDLCGSATASASYSRPGRARTSKRAALPAGDYAVEQDGQVVAARDDDAGALLEQSLPAARLLDPAEPTTADVRRWALDHGLDVSDRGRLRPEIWAAYRMHHSPRVGVP